MSRDIIVYGTFVLGIAMAVGSFIYARQLSYGPITITLAEPGKIAGPIERTGITTEGFGPMVFSASKEEWELHLGVKTDWGCDSVQLFHAGEMVYHLSCAGDEITYPPLTSKVCREKVMEIFSSALWNPAVPVPGIYIERSGSTESK